MFLTRVKEQQIVEDEKDETVDSLVLMFWADMFHFSYCMMT